MYIPNLIPKEYQILPDYFKNKSATESKTESLVFQIIGYAIGIICLIFALKNLLNRFWLGFFLAILGLSFLPKGHRWVEKQFRFDFTNRIKGVFAIILLSFSLVLTNYYSKTEKKIAYEQKIQAQKEEKEAYQAKLATEKQEKLRKDSLDFYIQQANSLSKNKNFANAIILLDKSLFFAKDEKLKIVEKKAEIYTLNGQNDKAIDEFTNAIQYGRSADLYIKRANCYLIHSSVN